MEIFLIFWQILSKWKVNGISVLQSIKSMFEKTQTQTKTIALKACNNMLDKHSFFSHFRFFLRRKFACFLFTSQFIRPSKAETFLTIDCKNSWAFTSKLASLLKCSYLSVFLGKVLFAQRPVKWQYLWVEFVLNKSQK